MSHTLVFKKGGVEILSLGIHHPFSKAFTNAPYDVWELMQKSEFADAMWVLTRQDEDLEDESDMLGKMLEHSTNSDERWEIVIRLNSIKKERRALADAKVMVHMLEMIWEEGQYTDDETKVGLEWAVL